MKSLLTPFALLAFAAASAIAATGDVQFGVVGSSGALTSQLVTPGTPPAVFGTGTDGGLKSFSLGTGLTVSGGSINASGGSWADLSGVPATITSLGSLTNSAGVLSNNGTGTLSWGQVTNAQLAGSIATSKLSVSANVKTVLDAADLASIKTALNLTPGTDVQAQNSVLQTLADGGTLSASQGGTGLASYTVGDILYASAAGTLAKVAGNTSTTRKVLTSTGTGSAATPPAWNVPDIAVGTMTTTGAAAGDLLASDGTNVAKITPGSGVATALANAVDGSGGLLTYGIIGTSGAKVPLLNAANTFATGQLFGGNNGDYISLGSSAIRELRISSNAFGLGTNAFLVGMYDNGDLTGQGGGTIYFRTNVSAQGSLILYSDVQWNDGTSISKTALNDLFILDYYTGTNAQRFRVANSYSGSTNWEAAVLDWKTEANVLRVGSDVGSGGGTARDVKLVRGGAVKVTLGTNTTDHAQPVRLPNYEVAVLPDPATCGRGSMAVVWDSGTNLAGSVVVGGGSYTVLVVSDGVSWIVH